MPVTFTDSLDRVWTLRPSTGMLADIRAECGGLDLLRLMTAPSAALRTLVLDPEMLTRALWRMVEADASKHECDKHSFEDLMDGPALERALLAVLRAAGTMVPRPAVAEAVVGHVERIIESIDDQAIREIERKNAELGKGN